MPNRYPERVISGRPSSPNPGIRAARGVLLGVSSAVLTLTAHTVADGAMPDPSLAVAIAALFGWAATTLADRRRMLGILLTLAGAQLVIHLLLTLLSAHPTHAASPVSDGTMLAAHAIATVVLAGLLSTAECGLVTVASALRRLLPVVAGPAPFPLGPAPAVVAPAAAGGHPSVRHPRVNARRGPPTSS